MLSQKQDGHERRISYASRRLTKGERRYCVVRKESLAVVFFRKYSKNQGGQMARWLEIVYEFDMDIQHGPGTKHGNADSRSRLLISNANR